MYLLVQEPRAVAYKSLQEWHEITRQQYIGLFNGEYTLDEAIDLVLTHIYASDTEQKRWSNEITGKQFRAWSTPPEFWEAVATLTEVDLPREALKMPMVL